MNNDFQNALDNLPDRTAFDHTVHHEISDLVWCCLHEIDLHHEGEYRHTIKSLNAFKKFIAQYGDEWANNELKKIWAQAVARRDFYLDEVSA